MDFTRSSKADDFQSPDFYGVDELLSEEQLLVRASVRDFCKKEISPIIEDAAQQAKFPRFLVKKMGEMGLFGPVIPETYGGMGADYMTYGLMMQELERVDSGIRSTASVQGSLVMFPVFEFGSEEQRRKYLPALAAGEMLGSFGLTEPDFGSNPGGMRCHFQEDGDYLILNGSKTWISNAPYCDMAVVWAKNEMGRVKGLIVERGMEGFTTPEIKNKWSLRASATGELVFDQVKVPRANLLPGADGLRAPLRCLDNARFGISWGAIGAAMDCYDTALKYALERVQFDKPIASFQLIQKKLAEFLTEITKAQVLTWKLAKNKDNGTATSAQISLAKRNNVAMALHIAREARQILGGNGITGEYSIMRHMANLESVVTYEGTHDIHLLILGQEITGIPAFK